MTKNRTVLFFILIAGVVLSPTGAYAIGQTQYVQGTPGDDNFPVVQGGRAAMIYLDTADWPGVARAAGDLQSDIERVTGIKPEMAPDRDSLSGDIIIIGTLGKSSIIDDLVMGGKIRAIRIAGKWESFQITVVDRPLPGVSRALVICGSDKRGTIYGIYDLSEQMGVSPLYWWADVPVQHRDEVYVERGLHQQGPPSVKYRGIFLNDEAPDLSEWVREKFGEAPVSEDPPVPEGVANYNSEFYSRIFEVILRMKGNYLWPAMWNNAFNEDDPRNPRLADEYGIVMGTTHQEPMLRAQKEWDRRYQSDLGSWNYYRNPNTLQKFWREGIRRNKDYESIITLGLRGANDTPMIPGGTVEQSMELLEEIVKVQREMITEELNPDLTQVPQLWCLYKEVQEYYSAGLRVPDDVTLLWSDDNWGNIRRLPTEEERKRAGGAGIYYHFDYVGGPRNYKWINTVSIPKVWQQLHLAKEYGADRIWIVNVGHFKHVLFPMEFFLNMGWDADRWTHSNVGHFSKLWAEREFGEAYAEEIADIVGKYTRYNARRKPELLSPTTYSMDNYLEAERIVANFQEIALRAETIYRKLPEEFRDAFYDLVLFPVTACAVVNDLYVSAGKNALYAAQGRAATNDLASRVEQLFETDADLMDHYNHTFADGKWNHFMDQVHIGYTIWQDPPRNIMPEVQRIDIPEAASMGVSVEGASSVWPVSAEKAVLPTFDPLNRQRHYFEVFNKGREAFGYRVETDSPWIVISSPNGIVDKEDRIWVSINWDRIPLGTRNGKITVHHSDLESVEIEVPLNNSERDLPDTFEGFVDSGGFVSIEAEHFTKQVPTEAARWKKIEGYGRTLSAMTIVPVTASSVRPPYGSPCLEYEMYLFTSGKLSVLSYFAPTLNFNPQHGLRYAVSIDDETPQILDIVPEGFDARNGNREWENSVRNSIRIIRSEHEVSSAGYHTLKVWMVDPAVVLEKIVVDLGGLNPSYLGPPESNARDAGADSRE